MGEVTGKGSRTKVTDSRAIALVEVDSVTRTGVPALQTPLHAMIKIAQAVIQVTATSRKTNRFLGFRGETDLPFESLDGKYGDAPSVQHSAAAKTITICKRAVRN